MGTERYTKVNGKVIAEKRGDARRLLRSDSLGNVIGLYDDNQTLTDTTTYWPYGEVRSQTGSFGSKLKFSGALGCRTNSDGRIYMRARTQQPKYGRWLTVDPLWPVESGYGYANSSPATNIESTGYQVETLKGHSCEPGKDPCLDCALAIHKQWFPTHMHHCNNFYSHCMACCTLTRFAGKKCAESMQNLQNLINSLPLQSGYGQDWKHRQRWHGCHVGIGIGLDKIRPPHSAQGDCSARCLHAFPLKWPNPNPGCERWMFNRSKEFPFLDECKN